MLKIAVFMDKIEVLEYSHDTTIFLICAGLKRGHYISIFYEDDIFVKEGLVYSNMRDIKLSQNIIEIFKVHTKIVREYDVLLMRKDPPVDLKYITTASILSLVESKTVKINSPIGILSLSEKLWPSLFKLPQPPTLISSNYLSITEFKKEHKDIVLKPLYNYCGNEIYISIGNDLNFFSVLKTLLSNTHKLPMIAQKYLSAVKNGDKRIIMLGGSPVGVLNRIAGKYDHRCNMKVGGTPQLQNLSEKEIELCDIIGPQLLRYNLHFVGLDVIGDYITEINTTTPTGLVQIKELGGKDLSVDFWNYVEGLLK